MTRVLLVTGSRSLATIPGAEAWARELIRHALDGVDLLIVGDASGPDAWAVNLALSHGVGIAEHVTRGDNAGWTVDSAGKRALRWTMDVPPRDTPAEHGREAWARWLLSRNAAMVRRTTALAPREMRACLALLDGTKRDAPGKRATRGTEHTAGLAERAGITVTREVWG